MIIVACKPVEIPEVWVEPTVCGCQLLLIVSEVPFADYSSRVTQILQVLRQDFARRQGSGLCCTQWPALHPWNRSDSRQTAYWGHGKMSHKVAGMTMLEVFPSLNTVVFPSSPFWLGVSELKCCSRKQDIPPTPPFIIKYRLSFSTLRNNNEKFPKYCDANRRW